LFLAIEFSLTLDEFIIDIRTIIKKAKKKKKQTKQKPSRKQKKIIPPHQATISVPYVGF